MAFQRSYQRHRGTERPPLPHSWRTTIWLWDKFLTHSATAPFWKDTCLFAIEDDPQMGWDHISGYRTTAYVASPYTKRGQVIHTQYNQTSLMRTMELILGLPPMNQLDATATPMFDCFVNQPDFTPFNAVSNNVPLDQMNPAPRRSPTACCARTPISRAGCPLTRRTNVRRASSTTFSGAPSKDPLRLTRLPNRWSRPFRSRGQAQAYPCRWPCYPWLGSSVFVLSLHPLPSPCVIMLSHP